ncbi:MAG TPA: hypothetical protein VMT30_03410 [Candidatus Saccharimonadia bacterium]|nr:hypothetical protein [Candidatus Saccharimonadia bacterium]
MYGQGNLVPPVLGAATTAAVLPLTGVNNAVEIALAAATGLAVWALIYVAAAKYGKR